MSTINFSARFKLSALSFMAVIGLSGCFEQKVKSSDRLPFQTSELSYHGATPRNLGLQFNLSGNYERTIKATVQLPEYLDFKNQKLQYRWQIDNEVDVVEGEKTGEINVTTNDKSVEIRLRVKNFSSDSKKFVRLEVFSGIGRNRFYIDGIVSSQSESSFENFVQDIENYKKKVHWND